MNFTIRKIILRIVPYKLLRLVKKKANIDYLFFGQSKKNIGVYLVNDPHSELNLYGMEAQLGPLVTAGFTATYNEYMQQEGLMRKYILSVNDCIIEPVFGWGITAKNNKLIFDSICNNAWIETYYPSWFAYKKNKSSAIVVEEAVSINILRGGDANYWHFLHDLLGQVTFAIKNISADVPFIISKSLSERSFFKRALEISPELAKINWLIRDKAYFQVKKAWFIQPLLNSNEQFFNVRDILHIKDSTNNADRKIFLKRSPARIRYLKNEKELTDIAEKYGFEIIDTDELTLQQQIILFGETKYMIGIHGAGLTNILFRKNAPLHMLELLPADYLQPHYFWLNKGMGHHYDCLVGTISAIDTSFQIDAAQLEEKIKKLLNSGILHN